MSDRLEEIKNRFCHPLESAKIFEEHNEISRDDAFEIGKSINWLISEVERLRAENKWLKDEETFRKQIEDSQIPF
ncbi:MAG: hypothetical protein ABF608_07100 [Sporolactobacillus sp.]